MLPFVSVAPRPNGAALRDGWPRRHRCRPVPAAEAQATRPAPTPQPAAARTVRALADGRHVTLTQPGIGCRKPQGAGLRIRVASDGSDKSRVCSDASHPLRRCASSRAATHSAVCFHAPRGGGSRCLSSTLGGRSQLVTPHHAGRHRAGLPHPPRGFLDAQREAPAGSAGLCPAAPRWRSARALPGRTRVSPQPGKPRWTGVSPPPPGDAAVPLGAALRAAARRHTRTRERRSAAHRPHGSGRPAAARRAAVSAEPGARGRRSVRRHLPRG